MKLKTGDILLVDTEGIVSSTIDVFQGNDYNHAGFIFILDKITYVLEATKNGVCFTPFKEYEQKEILRKCNLIILRPKYYGFDGITDEKLLHFTLPLTNKAYGFDNLFLGQSIRYITKFFGKERWLGQNKSTDKFICGKLVAYVYNQHFGTFDNNWWKLAPADIYNSNEFEHIEYTR